MLWSKAQHSIEGHASRNRHTLGHFHFVAYVTARQRLQAPQQKRWMYSIHSGTRAHLGIEAEDFLIGHLFGEAAHEVDLGSYRPIAAAGSCPDRLNYEFSRTVEVAS